MRQARSTESERESAELSGRHKRKTGVAIFDTMLEGSYPSPSTVVVSGEAGRAKTVLCQSFLGECIKRRRVGVYMALDDFPHNVRKSLSTLGYDVKKLEADNRLTFIDCYSGQIGLKSHERYFCETQNVYTLSITISTVLMECGQEAATTIILDSLTPILQRWAKPSLELLRVLVAKARNFKADLWITLNRRAFDETVVALVYDIVDGVIELRNRETKAGPRKEVRVLEMKGVHHETQWVPYELHPRKGLVPSGQIGNSFNVCAMSSTRGGHLLSEVSRGPYFASPPEQLSPPALQSSLYSSSPCSPATDSYTKARSPPVDGDSMKYQAPTQPLDLPASPEIELQ